MFDYINNWINEWINESMSQWMNGQILYLRLLENSIFDVMELDQNVKARLQWNYKSRNRKTSRDVNPNLQSVTVNGIAQVHAGPTSPLSGLDKAHFIAHISVKISLFCMNLKLSSVKTHHDITCFVRSHSEPGVIVDQVQTNYHGRPMVL